jgi:hypothetical protein
MGTTCFTSNCLRPTHLDSYQLKNDTMLRRNPPSSPKTKVSSPRAVMSDSAESYIDLSSFTVFEVTDESVLKLLDLP